MFLLLFRMKSKLLVLTELGVELVYEVITELAVVMGWCIDFNVFISFPLFKWYYYTYYSGSSWTLYLFSGSVQKTDEVGKIGSFQVQVNST